MGCEPTGASRNLWAKKSNQPNDLGYLPLYAHLADAAKVAGHLWDSWVSENIRNRIEKKLFIFLAAAHDIGKATPVFQAKGSRIPNAELDSLLRSGLADAGFSMKDSYPGAQNTRHELATHTILKRQGLHNSLCVVLSGHHGKPPSTTEIYNLKGYQANLGFDRSEWIAAQDSLYFAALSYAGFTRDDIRSVKIGRPEQVLLSGLVILADWISSDENLFPLVDINHYSGIDSARRAETAMENLALPSRWAPDAGGDLYSLRFGIEKAKTRSIQETAQAVAKLSPGIMVIEAPMGEGKTEAALVAAEILANDSGRRGLYFALPTQATSDAMFSRVVEWIEKFDKDQNYAVRLVQGKADLNERYREIKLSSNVATSDFDEMNTAYVHEWLGGRKKAVLADFAVGTIDHVLMMGLKQKHLALRHLGFAGKVVVLDEVHAYDVYMNSYLLVALSWLGAYRVPVVVLSATLPAGRRQELLSAYMGRTVERIHTAAYPLITYSLDGRAEYEQAERDGNRARDVSIRRISDGELMSELEDALSGGGVAAVIVNTVRRAQDVYQSLAKRFGKDCTRLLHARLLARDRSRLEKYLADLLGPPHKSKRPKKLILVGTQVLEQSLDFDFDIMISDLCPMDLLLQRVGRLHRHHRARPEKLRPAACLVLGASEPNLESGSEAVYGAYLLKRTRALLPDKLRLPDDIPRLVAGVYDEEDGEELKDERDAHKKKSDILKARAKGFQIGNPVVESDCLIGWLDTALKDDSEKRGEAAVRDGDESIEVIVVRQHKGELYLLDDKDPIPSGIPGIELAARIAECTVRLPSVIGKWNIDGAIKALERSMNECKLNKTWYASPLLKGSLCLILNENRAASLCGYSFVYHSILGLMCEKEDK